MTKRIAIVHPEWGIFLGESVDGGGWWSLYNPLRIWAGIAFEDVAAAKKYLFEKFPYLAETELTGYEVDSANPPHATILELIKGGIPHEYFGDMLATLMPHGRC